MVNWFDRFGLFQSRSSPCFHIFSASLLWVVKRELQALVLEGKGKVKEYIQE